MSIIVGKAWEPSGLISTGSLLLDNCFKWGAIPLGSIVQFYSPPENEGSFKCHPQGTKVLMYDGTYKDVSKIQVGDQLMGPDSQPRNVLKTGTGKEQCYRIIPTKGESWECNESHILHLVRSSHSTKQGTTFNITVKEWLEKSKWFKRDNLLYRPERIDFPKKDLPIHPYLLGLWLGDGTSHLGSVHISNPDKEIHQWVEKFCVKKGLDLKIHNYKGKCEKLTLVDPNATFQIPNVITDEFRKLNLHQNKHIPYMFKTASYEQRMQLLAGFIDTDGHCPPRNGGTYHVISQKSKQLTEDITFIARSLGFQCNVNKRHIKELTYNGESYDFYQISIIGNHSHKIPCKVKRKQANERTQIKNPLRTGFKVEPTGVKKYYGFQIDGDQLYLLKDFTITHNSSSGLTALAQFQKQGMKVGGIDTELTPWDLQWLESLGIQVTKKLWVYGRATSGEQSIDYIDELVKKHDCKAIMFDSIDYARPTSYHESDPGDSNTGTHAKLMRQLWQKVKDYSETHDVTFFIVNQSYTKVGHTPWDKGEIIKGGQAATYAPSVNIRMKRPTDSKLFDEDLITIKCQIKRSKLGGSWKKYTTYFMQSGGIDRYSELAELGFEAGICKPSNISQFRRGNKTPWYLLNGDGKEEKIGDDFIDARNWIFDNEKDFINRLLKLDAYKNIKGLQM